jgi:CBS domain containing-hemolysin-like protein
MVPRPDMVTIDRDLTVTAALDVAISEGYSRLPVVHESGDDLDVVGLAYTKDLMKAERDGRGDEPLASLVRQVRIVPENKPVSRLMREMQTDKFHMAVVADEHGSIVGIVALEDCLEELVGEIVDEFDQEEQEVRRLPNGDYLVVGKASVGDVNELLEVRVPDDDWDTVAGFVFNALGHVPLAGEFVEYDGWRFSVEQMEGRRIAVVRISAIAPAD